MSHSLENARVEGSGDAGIHRHSDTWKTIGETFLRQLSLLMSHLALVRMPTTCSDAFVCLAMDDDASYAAVTMIQTNVRAHQIRKRKKKERDANGASRDAPPTPVHGRTEETAARTEELDGWKRRAARAIALVLALLFVYVYRPMLWAVNVPSSLLAAMQRWILRPVARRLGFDLACCGGAVG